MKNLINFFFSFDKLMKHKLVPLFFWAALTFIAIGFIRDVFGATYFTKWIAWLTGWLERLSLVVLTFVGLRLVCELAIATFRISDNLSADGGASDLADIDPLEETRRAAEEAAKRAREVTGKAVDKTKSAASNLKDSAEKRFDKVADPALKKKAKGESVDQVFDKPVKTEPVAETQSSTSKAATSQATKSKSPSKKTTTPKKTTAKKTTAKKSTPAKKTTAKPSTSKTSSTTKKKTTAKKTAAKKTSTSKKS